MKRRQFAQSIALLAAGAALPAIAGIPSTLKCLQTGANLPHLSRDFFEARLGKVFQLTEDNSRSLLLKGVVNACGPDCREQFFAVFEASPGSPLEEGIYRLEHEHTGRFDLFLTESTQDSRRLRFVAIINHQTTA